MLFSFMYTSLSGFAITDNLLVDVLGAPGAVRHQHRVQQAGGDRKLDIQNLLILSYHTEPKI